jgi:hypothetical protein
MSCAVAGCSRANICALTTCSPQSRPSTTAAPSPRRSSPGTRR